MQPLHVAVTLAGLFAVSTSAFDDHRRLLANVLDSIDSGLTFMANEYKNLNLDAVIGTRFVEGIVVLVRNVTCMCFFIDKVQLSGEMTSRQFAFSSVLVRNQNDAYI